jgi:hypothetical protein
LAVRDQRLIGRLWYALARSAGVASGASVAWRTDRGDGLGCMVHRHGPTGRPPAGAGHLRVHYRPVARRPTPCGQAAQSPDGAGLDGTSWQLPDLVQPRRHSGNRRSHCDPPSLRRLPDLTSVLADHVLQFGTVSGAAQCADKGEPAITATGSVTVHRSPTRRRRSLVAAWSCLLDCQGCRLDVDVFDEWLWAMDIGLGGQAEPATGE